jgi:di/tricarboxylate transporter
MISEILSNWAMWLSMLIVVVAICFYMVDTIPLEIISLGIVVVLLILFLLPGATGLDGKPVSPDAILAGFANPALLTIMALLIIGQGLFQTGALERITQILVALFVKRPIVTLGLVFTIVFVTSAFINNTPVVIMFVPVLVAMAGKMGASPSKFLQPLSFISVLAGMTTLIGTSTNLLAADVYKSIEGRALGFFELAPMGLPLAAIGALYILIFARILLPSRDRLDEGGIGAGSGRQFIAQIEVRAGHVLSGKRPTAGLLTDLPNMTLRMIQRGEQAILPPFSDVVLRPGDLVILAATRKVLTAALARRPELIEGFFREVDSATSDGTDEPGGQLIITEAVIAPGSRMTGRTIEQVGFHRQTGAIVLGIQRRSRMIRTRLGEIRLEAGDTLLLCGTEATVQTLRSNRDLLPLEWSRIAIPDFQRSRIASVIAVVAVACAALEIAPILHASLVGALAMILTGCLNVRQATRALDLRIFMLIGAALAMGTALQQTGAADYIALQVVTAAAPYGPMTVLSMLFLTVAIITNILSNSATAVLFTPIAISTANQLGLDPTPFVLAVIYAANCSFATPVAYQTNLLVMGPGHYKFGDYVRFGGPLVIVLWIAFTILAPMQFDLTPL